MPLYELDPYHMEFPDPELASEDGLLAIGGELRADWLLTAYESGIFPWFNEGDPYLWWSPDPRFVLFPDQVKVRKSMRPYLNNPSYEFKFDTAFDQVIEACASIPRRGQDGTWLTAEMKLAYQNLHRIGMAHSAEIWKDGSLVGGLYGVSIGKIFFGESMFSLEPNSSKLALIRLCQWLKERSFLILDCQIHSDHLEQMGAELIPRTNFLEILENALDGDTLKGKWTDL